MSISTTQARQPRGIPVGGQFAGHDRDDADLTLTTSANWGELSISEGSRTPWGAAQHVAHVADGIVIVDTEGHGGVKLSKERNAAIPPSLRDSWYEEDVAAYVPVMYHPEAFQSQKFWADLGVEGSREYASDRVREWFPDQWEAATGLVVKPGQSRVRDEQTWKNEHLDDFVGSPQRSTLLGGDNMVVRATRHSDGATKSFFITRADYDRHTTSLAQGQNRWDFVIDPGLHVESDLPATLPKVERPIVDAIDRHRGTATEVARVRDELAKLWRTHDGRIITGEQMIAEHQVTHKTAMTDNNGRTKYYLGNASSRIVEVSHALWKASGAPDDRDEYEGLRATMKRAEAASEKDPWSPGKRTRMREARAAYSKAFDADQERIKAGIARRDAITVETFPQQYAAVMDELRDGGWLMTGRSGETVIKPGGPTDLMQRVDDLRIWGQQNQAFA